MGRRNDVGDRVAGGMAYVGGVVLGTLIVLFVLLLLFVGCAGLVAWNHHQARLTLEKEAQAARLAEEAKQRTERERLQREQAAQEAERRRQEEATRRHYLDLQKAEAEAERVKAEAEKARAEAARAEADRRAKERAEQLKREREEEEARRREEAEEAARRAERSRKEAERARKEWEEFHRPIPLALTELWRKSSDLKGRTVVVEAAANCKLLPAGRGLVVRFYDPKGGRLWVRAHVDAVDPKWALAEVENFNVKVKIQGVVKSEKGVIVLQEPKVLALK